MNLVTVALLIVFATLMGLWVLGGWLLRRDRRLAEAVEAAEQARSDREYQRSRDDKAIANMVAEVRAEAVACGAYCTAVELGAEPVMPARTMAEARRQRLSRREVERADAEVDRTCGPYVDLDSIVDASTTASPVDAASSDPGLWWMQSAGRFDRVD